MGNVEWRIADADDASVEIAIDLLCRFFAEEGFSVDSESVAANTRRMFGHADHWIGLAWMSGEPVGVVTVTSMLYVEWGRLGEIGDLYVVPNSRSKGIGAALVEAAKAQCANLGCSAVSVVVTREGEARHGLSRFYERFGFGSSGRSILTHVFS